MRPWPLSVALAIVSMTTPAHAQGLIDAEQFCGRTPEVRDAILREAPGATCIDADPDAVPPAAARYETSLTAIALASVERLDLALPLGQLPTIKVFRPGDFDGLIGLRSLILVGQVFIARTGPKGSGIPLDVLGRLETLILANSNLMRLESADYFAGLSNLRTLVIPRNNMVYELPGNPNRPEGTWTGRGINPEVWRNLANLRKLEIGSNRILTLPRGFFGHLANLEELDMYDMWYEYHPYGFGSQALPAGVFEGLTRLRKLDLGYNAIGAEPVAEGLFDGLTSLEDLDLRDNPLLEVLPESVLDLPAGVRVRTDPGVAWPSERQNRAPTGRPLVSGTARVGETLTASAQPVSDQDGLANAEFTWQWLSSDETGYGPIAGAVGPAYTLVPEDAGKTIKVRLTFTDDGGTEEAVESEPTTPVALAASVPEVSIEALGAAPTEGGDARFTLRRTGSASAPLTVTVVVAETGSMVKGTLPTAVSFDASASTAELAVETEDDEVAEAASEITAAIVAGNGHSVDAHRESASVTVEDDDEVPAVTTISPILSPEGGTVVATLQATDADTPATDLSWSIAGGADASAFSLTPDGVLAFKAAKDFEAPDDADTDGDYEVAARVTDGANSADSALTVRLVDVDDAAPTLSVADAHAASGALSFRVTLSEAATSAVTVDWATSDGTAVAGSDYEAGSGTLTFAAGETAKSIGIAVLADGTTESEETLTLTLSNASGATLDAAAATGTITDAAEPLTASLDNVPAEHGGTGTTFTLGLTFSEKFGLSYRTVRAAFEVDGGSVRRARRRMQGSSQGWNIEVGVDTDAAVTVRLPETTDCGASGALCTNDGRPLATALSATVSGLPGISVADAQAKEGPDAAIEFAVTLDRTPTAAVTVAYATADGTARAGADYTRQSGTLTFAPGATQQLVVVPLLDDAHDEGAETFTLTLSNPSGAWINDGQATGTIKNDDPLQRAWLARFGRTVATHVTDAVGERLRGTSGQDSHLTVGGYRLPVGKRAAAGERGSALLGLGPARSGPEETGRDPWMEQPNSDPRLGQSRTLRLQIPRLREVLLGSSFRLALGAEDPGSSRRRLTAWGRFAGTQFGGKDRDLTLDGDVLTGTVGVDGAWARWLAGVAVSHSRGDGSFTMPGTAERGQGGLENTLTSIHPYLRYAVNDRLDVWGLFGYGWGELDLDLATGATLETDTNLFMGAFGGRGILLAPADTGGFQLATRTDAMLTRTTSEEATTADGRNLESADAEAHRLRLILEGSRGFTWAEGRRLTPTVELGLRHDWGDAEAGFGLELSGRMQYADPALGLTVEGAVRALLAHEDDDYEEWGAWGTVRVAPGAAGQGLSLTLSPTWGATASGVQGLWSRQTTAGLAPQGNRNTPGGRLTAEVGYGFAAFDAGLLTPYAGVVLADGADRTYRVGGRLRVNGYGTTGLELSLEGRRQELAGQQPLNQGLQFQATWGF